MDITEAFRSEDISKTDFFDFVVTPDVSENQQTINFNRTLKSMGIFLENDGTNAMGAFNDIKETNNNNLMMNTASSENPILSGVVGNFVDHSFWSTPSCDKEAVRLETAILEDLNKFCWTQDSDIPSTNNASCQKEAVGGTTVAPTSTTATQNRARNNNTDGAIYTLTVLNGGNNTPSWYRPPETATNVKEEEENQQSLSSPHAMECQPMSAHNSHQNNTSALDLDSILSIIPDHSQNSNGHQYHQDGYQQNHQSPSTHLHHTNSSSTLSPHHGIHHESLIKSERQYSYDDSGFTNKDCSNVMTHIVERSMLDTSDSNSFSSNNNNDWKLTNNNSTSNASADSLLRSALQGKSFLGRYNGTPKNGKAMGTHAELRRVLSTPPGGTHSTSKSLDHSPVFMNNSDDDGERKHSPLMTVSVEGNAVVMFDDAGGGRSLGMIDSDNPSSTHSMDDILLSQLDTASYPEDYEKLKRIATEVAESVHQYCSLDQNSVSIGSPSQQGIFISTHLSTQENIGQNSILSSAHHPHLSPILSTSSASCSSKNGGKKYSKKHSSGNSNKTSQSHQLQSNGVRKERSLHYCSICSKGFKDKYSVNVHIRTHTGEKPFACSLCGKSFRQKAHLAKHYQTHIAQKNGTNNGATKSSANKGRFTSTKSS